jgi:hypothetical protein
LNCMRLERSTSGWLFVTHFFKCCDDGNDFLSIEQESAGKLELLKWFWLQRTWTAPLGLG